MSIVSSLADNAFTNKKPGAMHPELSGWVMSRVDKWRDDRDQTYQKVWGEYWRIWRGRWNETDRTRKSERSKLVSPALSQALDMTVAELEEATFGRENWVDILDNEGDPDHKDILGIRRKFLEDMKKDKVPSAFAQCYLNGGLYGTLAGKVVVEKSTQPTFQPDPRTVPEPGTEPVAQPKMIVKHEPRVSVKLVPIPVTELVPDPNGTCVEDMLGVAHEVAKPRAWLLSQPWGKEYAKRTSGDTGASRDEEMDHADREAPGLLASDPNRVLVTEYHGKVPKRLLQKDSAPVDDDPLASAIISGGRKEMGELDGEELVEAIVIVLDKNYCAYAIENPFLMGDRSIVTCQFERVPGRFHGRGIMEKGYNPQKALDAELRTRMDVMALISNPQMGADGTALPRGFDLRTRPGKVWITNGSPKDAIYPIAFPNLDPASFNQTAEMERMVQMGTGAMDTATPLNENRRNETATGSSLIAGTFVKRAKRSLRNITENFVEPIVQKILWRRMEFDPLNYPRDFEFRIVSTLGIVARELEQNQLTQMMGLVEPGSQTQRAMVKAIFDSSSSPFKAELEAALEQDAQPDPQAQQMQQMQLQMGQLELQEKQIDVQKQQLEALKIQSEIKEVESKILLNLAKMEEAASKPGVDFAKLQNERDKLQIELEEIRQFARQNDIAAFKAQVDAVNQSRGNNGSQSTTSNG